MKKNPGLTFIALILVMFFAAVAVRAFEVNKRSRAGKGFTLTIDDRALLRKSKIASFKADLGGNARDYAICFRENPSAGDESLHAGNGPQATCDQSKAGSPHVQQTMTFQTAEKLKVIVDDLQVNRGQNAPMPSPSTPPPGASPAPQVQQHVESTTPQAAKAITVALSR